jgi:hypothetical protein
LAELASAELVQVQAQALPVSPIRSAQAEQAVAGCVARAGPELVSLGRPVQRASLPVVGREPSG